VRRSGAGRVTPAAERLPFEQVHAREARLAAEGLQIGPQAQPQLLRQSAARAPPE
jgi:hypothetical protein